MTMSCVVRTAAVAIVLLAVAISVIPRLIYTDLPADLNLDLTNPTTMIVTGANSGLGLATVQHFAHNEKAIIIMACRSMARCEKGKEEMFENLGAANVKADLRPMTLDLSHKSSIEAFAKELQGQPIHILINNAGLAGVTPELYFNEEDGIENHIRVNHLGHVYLTHCLWKNLQMAEQARVVAVSSIMAASTANGPTFGWYDGEERFESHWNVRMYACSKRANLFWANELHWRYKDDPNSSGISVVAAHPGFTHTELCRKGCKGQNKIGRAVSNNHHIDGIIKMIPEDGALSQSYAAVVPRGGVYLAPSLVIVGEPKIIGDISSSWHHMPFTRDESKRLWDKSMEAMGIKVFGDYEVPVEEVQQGEEEVQQEAVAEAQDEEEVVSEAAPTANVEEQQQETGDEAVEEQEEASDSDDDDDEGVFDTYLGEGEYRTAVVM